MKLSRNNKGKNKNNNKKRGLYKRGGTVEDADLRS